MKRFGLVTTLALCAGTAVCSAQPAPQPAPAADQGPAPGPAPGPAAAGNGPPLMLQNPEAPVERAPADYVVTNIRLEGLQRRCHVGAVAVLFRAFAGLQAAGPGHVQGVRFGGAGEQLGQGVELDRIGVFFDVVLAGDRPHHLRSALVCLVDHRVHLAGQFQIDCHD